jgi:nitroreductase
MSELSEVLRGRRSVRHFSEEELTPEVLEAVLADAAWAPSGGNDQPWAVTALSPASAAEVRAGWERRGWNALLPKIATLVERSMGTPMDFEAARPAALAMVESTGLVRGRPWMLCVHEQRSPVPPAKIAAMLAGANASDHAIVELMNGPLEADVTRLSAGGFVVALCLAAAARGLGTCIQSSYVAFEPELRAADWLRHAGPLVTTVQIGVPDADSPVNARAATAASRRPVPVIYR